MSEEIRAAIDEELRTEHIERLDECAPAIRLYDRLCQVVTDRPEGIDAAAQHIVAQIAELERIAELAREDVRQKGIRDKYRNGRQTVDRENKSINTIQRCIEQQRKLMSELRITPASRKTSMQGSLFDDDFGTF